MRWPEDRFLERKLLLEETYGVVEFSRPSQYLNLCPKLIAFFEFGFGLGVGFLGLQHVGVKADRHEREKHCKADVVIDHVIFPDDV